MNCAAEEKTYHHVVGTITNTFDGQKPYIVVRVDCLPGSPEDVSVTISWKLWTELGKPPKGVDVIMDNVHETSQGWRAESVRLK